MFQQRLEFRRPRVRVGQADDAGEAAHKADQVIGPGDRHAQCGFEVLGVLFACVPRGDPERRNQPLAARSAPPTLPTLHLLEIAFPASYASRHQT